MERSEKDGQDQKDKIETAPINPVKKRIFRILGLVLILAGIAVLLYPLSTFWVERRAQDTLRQEWNKKVEQTRQEETKNTPEQNKQVENDNESKSNNKTNSEPSNRSKVPKGKAAFRLIIPKIGVDMIVVEGTDTASLKLGPGHITRTVQPGEPGVCVISGHRTTYGGMFFNLDKVKPGDKITVETPSSRFTFTVYETKTVKPSDTSFMKKPTSASILALTTCTPIHSASQRLVVFAKIT